MYRWLGFGLVAPIRQATPQGVKIDLHLPQEILVQSGLRVSA
jgi:hypothetical protein